MITIFISYDKTADYYHLTMASISERCEDQGEDKQYVFVMRHGERLDSTDMSWRLKTDRPYDTPITERGKTEAHHISLKRYSDKNIKRVISSPFLRCLQTAQQVCDATGVMGVVTRNILSEIMSSGANISSTPLVPVDNITDYNINVIEYDKDPLPSYPEALDQSISRYKVAVQKIADEYYPENIVLVTHQYGVETAILLGMRESKSEYEASYCGNVELVREGRDGQWNAVSKYGVYEYDSLF